uniref:Scavenger receptor class B member 1 n=1 Tax=Ixodes ricinus TaxID=34613 RepID=A0A147BHB4_IXORI
MTCYRDLAKIAAFGFLLMVLGGSRIYFGPMLSLEIFLKKLQLVNGSEVFELWRDIPLPAFQKVYFFNLTNPYEFLQEGKKPKLQEVGPYTFRSVKNCEKKLQGVGREVGLLQRPFRSNSYTKCCHPRESSAPCTVHRRTFGIFCELQQ